MCIWKTNRLSVNIIEIIKIENLSIIRVEVFMFNKIFSTLFDSGNPIKRQSYYVGQNSGAQHNLTL